MALSENEVAKVAELVQIELSEGEMKRFAEDLSKVVSYIDQLSAVDTASVAPIGQITGLINVAKEDVAVDCEIGRAEFLDRAPNSEGEYIKVRRVIDK